MLTMIDTMREATDIFIAEDNRGDENKLETQRAETAMATACEELDRRYGGSRTIGLAGSEYENVRLMGAVDIDGKRYARLRLYEGRWVFVPWIDAFAQRIGEKISVVWNNNTTKERFRISSREALLTRISALRVSVLVSGSD
jgi:hypothetical protein